MDCPRRRSPVTDVLEECRSMAGNARSEAVPVRTAPPGPVVVVRKGRASLSSMMVLSIPAFVSDVR